MNKRVLKKIPQVYTADILNISKRTYLVAGSEGRYPSYLVDIETLQSNQIADGPGGTMCVIQLPGKENRLVSVMGLFPPFIGGEAAIYLHSNESGRWITSKLLDLPFAHRCEVLTHGENSWLFAASVSKFKKNPEDWSLPGELYVFQLSQPEKSDLTLSPAIAVFFRNHGMARVVINREETICISGAEGIFSIKPEGDSGWSRVKIFDREVSEFALLDIDRNGCNVLVTIEPFHGNKLMIYDNHEEGWRLCFQAELDFGHGLSTGFINGIPSIVVGNRRGDRSLNLYSIIDLVNGDVRKTIIEKDAAPTQTKIFNYKSQDYILSSNQAKDEVALYY